MNARAQRDALLRRAIALSVLSIVLGAAMGLTGVVAALTSGSLSLLGFGFDAVVDSAASVALVWRFAIEARQPHRAERVEKIAEAVLGVVLIVVAIYLGISAARALIDRDDMDAEAIARKSLNIAADICVYTNRNVIVEKLS